MAKQLEPKILKHQQHLKLQKEAEEELWISGEELRTDGSSDEERQKNSKEFKKIKRRKSSTSSLEKKEAPMSSLKAEVKEEIFVHEENAIAIPVSWRPKRGSLKLPDLYEGVFDETKTDFFINDKIYEEDNMGKCLPMLKIQEIENITNYGEKLTALMGSISQLEEHFLKNMSFLEEEKTERLKIEEEMCSEISKDDHLNDRNGSLFLKLCNYEGLTNSKENNEIKQIVNDGNLKNQCKNSKDNKSKNFIRRNVELAAFAMSKLPLTDEEKHRLEEILSDIDLTDTEANNNGESSLPENTNDNENENLQNAFHVSKDDQQRLDEIDLELKNNFTETQNLRSSNNDNEENFWKSLVLDQMLKDIDEKLAELNQEDTEEC